MVRKRVQFDNDTWEAIEAGQDLSGLGVPTSCLVIGNDVTLADNNDR